MKATVFVLALFACSNRTYVTGPRPVSPIAAARTPIPEEHPKGSVQVTSRGIVQLRQGHTKIPALHVYMEVANDSDNQPWLVDVRRQVAGAPELGLSVPIFANSDQKTLPVIKVLPGERRVIDLFFQLPVNVTTSDALHTFELHWQVNTSRSLVAASNTFERHARLDATREDDPGYKYWWHSQLKPRGAFADTTPVKTHGSPVHVHRLGGDYRPSGQVAWL